MGVLCVKKKRAVEPEGGVVRFRNNCFPLSTFHLLSKILSEPFPFHSSEVLRKKETTDYLL